MSKKVYRICLLVLIVAGVVGGILLYRFENETEKIPEKGFLVRQVEEVVTIA